MDTSGRTVLDAAPGGGGGARIFNKDELAAVLKFGAAELFAGDDGAGAPGAGPDGAPGAGGGASGSVAAGPAGAPPPAPALMTDADLDALLERAEVVEAPAEGGAAGALLSSFNVATFRADEDDAAFWSRLIPEHLRPKEEPAPEAAEPGIRAARLRAMEAAPAGGSAGGGGGGGGRRRAPPGIPGPPVPGALERLERWPAPEGAAGGDAAPRPKNWPAALSKKDAAAFLRAARRHPARARLEVVAAEAGGAVAGAPGPARAALWAGMLAACERVAAAAAARGGAPAPAAGGGPGRGGPDARLDFFGAELRAPEFLASVRQWALLDERARAAGVALAPGAPAGDGHGSAAAPPPPLEALRMAPGEAPPATAWTRALEWTIENDAALLIGAWRHGLIGAWDKCVGALFRFLFIDLLFSRTCFFFSCLPRPSAALSSPPTHVALPPPLSSTQDRGRPRPGARLGRARSGGGRQGRGRAPPARLAPRHARRRHPPRHGARSGARGGRGPAGAGAARASAALARGRRRRRRRRARARRGRG
jgi:chromodomain-helicase-DNA-binding protein 1